MQNFFKTLHFPRYTHTRTHKQIYTQTHRISLSRHDTHAAAQTRTRTHTHTHAHTHTHTHTHTRTHAHTHTQIIVPQFSVFSFHFSHFTTTDQMLPAAS